MSRYVKKPRKTNANSRGRTVNKGNVRNKAGKVASNSKAKVNSKQKEGLIDRALTAFAKKLKKKNGIVDSNPPYLYNRCHLIAYCLTAENSNEKNLITGTRYQ